MGCGGGSRKMRGKKGGEEDTPAGKSCSECWNSSTTAAIHSPFMILECSINKAAICLTHQHMSCPGEQHLLN